MRPEPIQFASPPMLPCPACGEPLEEDRDGTSCDHCGGLLVARVWAERCLPMMGRPALPPVFVPTPKELACPGCRRTLAPVLCHGVASWSCGRCRWLFFEGQRRRQLAEPSAPAPMPQRELPKAGLLAVISERARRAPEIARDAVGIVVLAAVVIGVIVLEGSIIH